MLRESHPGLGPVELDRLKVRVLARANRQQSRPWARFVRSRAAVVAAIAAGGLLSTGATALGVSGLASSGSASIAQYGTQQPAAGSAPADNTGNGAGPGGGVQPDNSAGGKPGAGGGVLPDQQAAQAGPATRGRLPFTGLAVIPILLIGLSLLVAGLIARRVGSRPHDRPRS